MSIPASSSALRQKVSSLLPSLSSALRKGNRGRVGVVGGSLEYTGAPYFAAMSALRCGADLSHVFSLSEAGTAIKAYSGDVIVHPILEASPDWQRGVDKVAAWLHAIDVLVVGPGLGRDEFVMQSARALIRIAMSKTLVVIDGDGLWALREDDSLLLGLSERVVLTPNAVEAERLDKQLAGREIRAMVVRKGATDKIGSSLECSTEGSPRRCGGQGDLLAGCAAALLCHAKNETEQGIMLWGACDIVREASRSAFSTKWRGMIASDILAELPATMQRLYPV